MLVALVKKVPQLVLWLDRVLDFDLRKSGLVAALFIDWFGLVCFNFCFDFCFVFLPRVVIRLRFFLNCQYGWSSYSLPTLTY